MTDVSVGPLIQCFEQGMEEGASVVIIGMAVCDGVSAQAQFVTYGSRTNSVSALYPPVKQVVRDTFAGREQAQQSDCTFAILAVLRRACIEGE